MAAIAKSLIPQNLREPEPLQPIVMPVSAPDSLPPTPQPQVQLAPRVPTPLDQQIQHDQQKLEKIHFQQENPWGTANNHPGVGGKIAHVLSVAGNIAGDIFAPGVMPRANTSHSIRMGSMCETMKSASRIGGPVVLRHAGSGGPPKLEPASTRSLARKQSKWLNRNGVLAEE